MKIIQKDSEYYKTDESTKRIINKGIDKLETRLAEYYRQNIQIHKIFQDNVLIHDIINKKYYVYKCRVCNVQLRILYTVTEDNLIIISHFVKKNSDNEYMSYFTKVSSEISRE